MSAPAWLQAWPLVRDLYARMRAQQDKVRALAALAGINTRSKP